MMNIILDFSTGAKYLPYRVSIRHFVGVLSLAPLCSKVQHGRKDQQYQLKICAMVKSRYIGDGHPSFNRNPYNGYINPYYWVDDHPYHRKTMGV